MFLPFKLATIAAKSSKWLHPLWRVRLLYGSQADTGSHPYLGDIELRQGCNLSGALNAHVLNLFEEISE